MFFNELSQITTTIAKKWSAQPVPWVIYNTALKFENIPDFCCIKISSTAGIVNFAVNI